MVDPNQAQSHESQQQIVTISPELWNGINAEVRNPDIPQNTITPHAYRDFLVRRGLLTTDENGYLPPEEELKALATFEELQQNNVISRNPINGQADTYSISHYERPPEKVVNTRYGRNAGKTIGRLTVSSRVRGRFNQTTDEFTDRYSTGKSGKRGVLWYETVDMPARVSQERKERRQAKNLQPKNWAEQSNQTIEDKAFRASRQTRVVIARSSREKSDLARNSSFTMQPDMSAMYGRGGSSGMGMDPNLLAQIVSHSVAQTIANVQNGNQPATNESSPLKLSGEFSEHDLARANKFYKDTLSNRISALRRAQGLKDDEDLDDAEFTKLSDDIKAEAIVDVLGDEDDEGLKKRFLRQMYIWHTLHNYDVNAAPNNTSANPGPTPSSPTSTPDADQEAARLRQEAADAQEATKQAQTAAEKAQRAAEASRIATAAATQRAQEAEETRQAAEAERQAAEDEAARLRQAAAAQSPTSASEPENIVDAEVVEETDEVAAHLGPEDYTGKPGGIVVRQVKPDPRQTSSPTTPRELTSD